MDRPTNPFVPPDGKRGGGKVTVEMLHDMAERSNRMNYVIASGQPYFVNRKWEEATSKEPGKYVHFLDRQS